MVENGAVPTTGRAHFALLGQLDAAEAPLFAAALSLANWHRRHRFCSACGSATAPNRGGWSRQCGNCAAEHYPRVDPVVIMLAEHDGRLLLGRDLTTSAACAVLGLCRAVATKPSGPRSVRVDAV